MNRDEITFVGRPKLAVKTRGLIRWTPTGTCKGQSREPKDLKALVDFTEGVERIDVFVSDTREWFTIINKDIPMTGVYYANAEDVTVTYFDSDRDPS